MKQKLILVIFSLLAIISTKAQGNNNGQGGQKLLDYKAELNLTGEQVAKIKAINEVFAPQIRELKKTEPIDKAAIKKLNGQRKVKIEQILTPDQIKIWAELRQKYKEGQ